MATADEILATMSAEEEKAYLVIESDLRTITIPDEIKILGVESDDDVLRLHFKMPKMYGEFDLSGFELRVNYMNAGNEPDLYEVKDAAVSGDVIEFSWLVGRTAAKFKGDVKFIVCAKLIKADGVVEKEFNTTTAKLPVLEGLETSEAVVQLHPDIIEAILLRLSKLETSGGVTDEQIANALSEYLAENPVQPGATQEQADQIQANKEAIEELQKNGTGGGITAETDPTVPAWAKQPSKPTYTASEVGALPATTQIPIVPETLPNPQPIVINGVSYDGSEKKEITITAPDGGIATETDPTVPAWAKQPSKPTYTASEVGALPATTQIPTVPEWAQQPSKPTYTAAEVGALPATTQIPTVPETLPNPQPIVINGVSYDGSEKKEITVQAEAGAGIDDATPSTETTYSSTKIDALLNEQKEANAKQDEEIAKRAKDADLAAVAKSGSYNDLSNKPTIPTVPTALKNPNKLTLTGAVTAEYDGSEAVSVEIPEGGGGGSDFELVISEKVTFDNSGTTLEFDVKTGVKSCALFLDIRLDSVATTDKISPSIDGHGIMSWFDRLNMTTSACTSKMFYWPGVGSMPIVFGHSGGDGNKLGIAMEMVRGNPAYCYSGHASRNGKLRIGVPAKAGEMYIRCFVKY